MHLEHARGVASCRGAVVAGIKGGWRGDDGAGLLARAETRELPAVRRSAVARARLERPAVPCWVAIGDLGDV